MTSKSAANHKIARKPLRGQAHTMPASPIRQPPGGSHARNSKARLICRPRHRRTRDVSAYLRRCRGRNAHGRGRHRIDAPSLLQRHPPLRLTETLAATGCNICRVPAGMGVVDWHNPPRRELVIWLTGEVEFETSDGDIRRLAAGSIVLAEDRTGKGHISRHPAEGQLVVHVDLC